MSTTPRSRSIVIPNVEAEYVLLANGVPEPSINTVLKSETNLMDDYVTDNFRQRMRDGEVINNPCHRVDHKEYYSRGSYLAIRDSNGDTRESTGVGSWSNINFPFSHSTIYSLVDRPDLNLQNRISMLKQRALSNVDATPYAFLEDIGEIGETIRFLKNPLKSIVGLLASLKDVMRGYRVINSATAFADVWLTYRFALSPLVRSINDALEARTKVLNVPPRLFARARDDVTLRANNDFDYPVGVNFYSSNVEVDLSLSAGIMYEVSNPMYDWRYKYGLRFKDVPETMWDLFPYSFMIDRLFHVGQAIAGLVALSDPKISILAAWETSKINSSEYLRLNQRVQPGWTINHSDINRLVTDFSYDRLIWNPSFYDTIPPINRLGLIKNITSILDLVALITNFVIKR